MTDNALDCTPAWDELSREELEKLADAYHTGFHEAAMQAVRAELALFEIAEAINHALGGVDAVPTRARYARDGVRLRKVAALDAADVYNILDQLIPYMTAAYVASGDTGVKVAEKTLADEQFAEMMEGLSGILADAPDGADPRA